MANKPTEWFVNQGGKVHGPFTAAQLKQLAASNKINGDSQVRLGADGKWTPARNVKGLFPSREMTPAVSTAVAVAKPPTVPVTVVQAAPQQPVYAAPAPQPAVNVQVVQQVRVGGYQKRWSRSVAMILSLLIPGLGQLYKGQPINGLAWFVLTILGYVFFIVPGLILHFCCILGAAMGDPYR